MNRNLVGSEASMEGPLYRLLIYNCQWLPCMLTNRAEMSTLYIGTYIDASYQVLVHLATVSEEKIF
jgi:hypothetical protein